MKKTAFAALVLVLILLAACGKQPTEIPLAEIPAEIKDQNTVYNQELGVFIQVNNENTSESPKILEFSREAIEANPLFDIMVEGGAPKVKTPLYATCDNKTEPVYELEPVSNPKQEDFFLILGVGKQDTQAEGWYAIRYDDYLLYVESDNLILYSEYLIQGSLADEPIDTSVVEEPTVVEQPKEEVKQPKEEVKQPAPVVEQPKQPDYNNQPQQTEEIDLDDDYPVGSHCAEYDDIHAATPEQIAAIREQTKDIRIGY